MRTIIGLDTHVATCDYAVLNAAGKFIDGGCFATTALEIRKLLSGASPEKTVLVIEQGPMANWIRRVAAPKAHVVVSDTRRNNWIVKDGVKNDRVDAEKLARLYSGGFIKEIVQRDDRNEQLLRLVLVHHDLTRQKVSVKNKLKAKYRQLGVRVAGNSVYSIKHREQFLLGLEDNPAIKYVAELFYKQLDLLDLQIGDVDKKLQETAKQYPIVKLLMNKFPGMGLINSVTFVALIDCPERFATHKKLWTYLGLGLDVRVSGIGTPRVTLTHRGNRLLKSVIKGAILNALQVSRANKYRSWFEEQLKNGRPEYKARLTAARKMAKDMWLEWLAFNKV